MSSFHVNSAGVAGPCKAKQGKCPFGSEDTHFSSVEEARKGFEQVMTLAYTTSSDPHYQPLEVASPAEAQRLAKLVAAEGKVAVVETFTETYYDTDTMPDEDDFDDEDDFEDAKEEWEESFYSEALPEVGEPSVRHFVHSFDNHEDFKKRSSGSEFGRGFHSLDNDAATSNGTEPADGDELDSTPDFEAMNYRKVEVEGTYYRAR